MNLPILDKLKSGVKFDFSTLTDSIDQTEEYWNWWWSEEFKPGDLSLPMLISDDDPILIQTEEKDTVNCSDYRGLFDRQLFRFTENGLIPANDCLRRDVFGDLIRGIRAQAAVKLEGQPQIVFTAGGYGSGKSYIVGYLAESKVLPVGPSHTVNADVFKQLIPEYDLIRAVGDGRAGETVHRESVRLADELFKSHVGAGLSFIFESSMAYKEETLARIELAKANGYGLTMIAVLTPLDKAIEFAMKRAKDSRRFARKESFFKSHTLFYKVFRDYFPLFDTVKVFANAGGLGDTELVVEKPPGEELAILNPDVFNSPQFKADKP